MTFHIGLCVFLLYEITTCGTSCKQKCSQKYNVNINILSISYVTTHGARHYLDSGRVYWVELRQVAMAEEAMDIGEQAESEEEEETIDGESSMLT